MTEVELRNAVSYVWGEVLQKPDWQTIDIWCGGKKTTIRNVVHQDGTTGLDRFLKSFNWEKKIVVMHQEDMFGKDLVVSRNPQVTGFSTIELIMPIF